MELSIAEAQADMRQGCCSGGAGVLASALAWTAAAGVAISGSAEDAVFP